MRKGDVTAATSISDEVAGGAVADLEHPILLRLYQAEQRKIDRLWALVALGTALTSTLDLAALVDKALSLALEFSGHDEGSLMLQEPGRKALVIRAAVGGDPKRLGSRISLTSDSVASWVLREKRPLYLEGTGESVHEVTRRYRKDLPSSISLPLLTAQGKPLGVLSLNSIRKVAGLDSDDIEALQSMANQVAIAVENAELYDSLLVKEQQLQASAERLVNAQMEERRRVAYDIHDGLAQMLVATHQRLQTYSTYRSLRSEEAKHELELVETLLKGSIEEVRRVMANLRPSALDDFGLEMALGHYLTELGQEAGWQVDYQCNLGKRRLPAHIEATVFRIVQEAVSNVRKHAQSPTLYVRLARKADTFSAVVRDTGKGFVVNHLEQASGPGQQVGLTSMSERALALGGHLQVRSRPGRGTQVLLRLPLEPATQEKRRVVR